MKYVPFIFAACVTLGIVFRIASLNVNPRHYVPLLLAWLLFAGIAILCLIIMAAVGAGALIYGVVP